MFTKPTPKAKSITLNNDRGGAEETPLLQDHATQNSVPTPLPKAQISVMLLLRFCESAATMSIAPYLNQLLTSVIGGDQKQVGYYAGLMEATRQAIAMITVMYWSRKSDQIGRKPVVLLGTAALSLSMLSFGLSRTFWGLVISRCIFTAFNSNAGVIKSTIGEITDPSNRADAFALLHIPWAVGTSVGSLLGGSLSRPHERFPSLFKHDFWNRYPYFLPNAATATLAAIGVSVTMASLNETVPTGFLYKRPEVDNESDLRQPLIGSSTSESNSDRALSASKEDPVPLRALLNLRIMIPVLNYVFLSFLTYASNAIQPLFLAMPIAVGGLGLDPPTIGYVLGVYGAVCGLFQAFFLGRMVRRFGVKRTFVTSITVFLPMFTLSPVMNILARRAGVSPLVWALLVCQLSFSLFMELGYGCIYIYITSASPNKRSLGATNGIAQTLVSFSRIIAPGMANTLLSYSIEHDILRGYAVYAVLFFFGLGGVLLAMQLPGRLEKEDKQ